MLIISIFILLERQMKEMFFKKMKRQSVGGELYVLSTSK